MKAQYRVRSLAELILEGKEPAPLIREINTLVDAYPELRGYGNELGEKEKWDRLIAHMPACAFCLFFQNDLVGYWLLLPVADKTFEVGVAGENINSSLDIYDLEEFSIPGDYIIYLVDLYVYRQHRMSANHLIFKSFTRFLSELSKSGYFVSRMFAHTGSKDSIDLCYRLGFRECAEHKQHRMKDKSGNIVSTKIFLLDLRKDIDNAFFRADRLLYDRYKMRFFNKESPIEQLSSLDRRIFKVELQIRSLICRQFQDETNKVPSHIATKIRERLKAEAVRSPALGRRPMQTLSNVIEYADLMDLSAIIVSFDNYDLFSRQFPSKEAMITKFRQLSAIRNPIRHSREAREVVIKEGEASLIWFEEALDIDPKD